jgi:hypothetical protein
MQYILFLLLGRLLNIRPKIRKVNDLLVATTAPHIALLTFGLKLRSVIIDPRQKAVRIHARYCWFIPIVRHIPFFAITSIIYRYADWNPTSNFGIFAYQEEDMFSVNVRLKDGEEVMLVRFFGNGDFINNSWYPDWMLWEDFIEARITKGNQEEESRVYVDIISKLIGVPVENG